MLLSNCASHGNLQAIIKSININCIILMIFVCGNIWLFQLTKRLTTCSEQITWRQIRVNTLPRNQNYCAKLVCTSRSVKKSFSFHKMNNNSTWLYRLHQVATTYFIYHMKCKRTRYRSVLVTIRRRRNVIMREPKF